MPSTFGQLAPVGTDFWRDTTTARALPDGMSDVREGVVHTGAVHMGTDGVAGEQGFHHEAIVSYQGNDVTPSNINAIDVMAKSTGSGYVVRN